MHVFLRLISTASSSPKLPSRARHAIADVPCECENANAMECTSPSWALPLASKRELFFKWNIISLLGDETPSKIVIVRPSSPRWQWMALQSMLGS